MSNYLQLKIINILYSHYHVLCKIQMYAKNTQKFLWSRIKQSSLCYELWSTIIFAGNNYYVITILYARSIQIIKYSKWDDDASHHDSHSEVDFQLFSHIY